MLREQDKLRAEARLEKLTDELKHIHDNLTSYNIVDRVRRRNELMIQICNLKKWLNGVHNNQEPVMDYKITPITKLIL